MFLTVGRIGRPHGIRGEVTVDVRTDEPETRFAVGSVLRTDPTVVPARPAVVQIGNRTGQPWQVPAELTIEAARWHQSRLLVTFEGIYDRNLAEALRGTVLCVDSAQVAPPSDPDEFNDHQLVGLTAVDLAGHPLGEVVRIDHAPASDLLVLRRPDGHMVLVPFVKAIVPRVDLAGHRIVIDPPGGLFDL